MNDLRTNRDLYLAIDELSKQHKDSDRSLERYLLAVLNNAAAFSDRASLKLSEFYGILAAGFADDPAPFQDEWREQYAELPHKASGYAGWHATVVRQIVDLREMDESGDLKNKWRYFGLESPRGSTWYNFEPQGYLECATVGSLGGWEPGDDTGRDFVPGQTAAIAEDGSICTMEPEDVPRPQMEIASIRWEDFKDFVFCGQIYE